MNSLKGAGRERKMTENLAVREVWWPDGFGRPVMRGHVDGVRYAFFRKKHRLLIEHGGDVTIYDSADHHITGVWQQSRPGEPLAFTSQKGLLELEALTQVR
jgi:hypothetical protein